jgi:hypothetical protein
MVPLATPGPDGTTAPPTRQSPTGGRGGGLEIPTGGIVSNFARGGAGDPIGAVLLQRKIGRPPVTHYKKKKESN